jgi:DNA-binding HxlR family transcriptional regulator
MDRLAMLERKRLVSERTDPDHKQKVIYSLTDKSIDLLPILLEFIRVES